MCGVCGKGFCQSRTLAVHKILHMEESPHRCPTCSRSFNQRSNLKTHLLTHTDIRPYCCTSCPKVFRRNCDLRRHLLTHSLGGEHPEQSGSGEEAGSPAPSSSTQRTGEYSLGGDVSPAASPRGSPAAISLVTSRTGSPSTSHGREPEDSDVEEDDDDDDEQEEDAISAHMRADKARAMVAGADSTAAAASPSRAASAFSIDALMS